MSQKLTPAMTAVLDKMDYYTNKYYHDGWVCPGSYNQLSLWALLKRGLIEYHPKHDLIRRK